MVNFLGAVGGGVLGGAAVTIVIRAVDQFTKTFNVANAGMAKLGAGITAVGIAGAFAVGGLLKMSGQFEQTQIAFTTMLGSADEAQKLLQELADFAARTPFQIPDVEKNAKLLLAMGIELDKILPTMKALGDVAAGLSVPLERIALNFGQVRTQNRLTGRELRDFNIAGVPLIQEIAKNMGIAEKSVKDLVSAGKIGFDEVEKAFTTMSSEGGKFFDLMDAQSRTFLGQMSNIIDSLIQVGRVMGNVFLPAAKRVASALQVMVEFLQEHPTLVKYGAGILGIATALALVIGPLLIILALLPAMIAGFGTLTLVTLPMILAIAGITAALIGLGLIVFTVLDNWDEFRVGMALIWNDIDRIFVTGINTIIDSLNVLIRAFDRLANFFGFEGIGELTRIKVQPIDIKALTDAILAQRKSTEEIQKQNIALTEQEKLVQQLSGFLFDPKTGDIFKKGASLTSTDFETQAAFTRATRGQGIIINIENLVGLDSEEISRALSNELNNKVSL